MSGLPPLATKLRTFQLGSFLPILLQKLASISLRVKMRNNRIGTNGFLNQHCAFEPNLESMLLARMRKIFLQQNLPITTILHCKEIPFYSIT
jgi:hypothetical protein